MSIILQTGGLAFGDISIRSRPSPFAISIAFLRGNTPRLLPELPMT